MSRTDGAIIRPCRSDESTTILAIVNTAAEAYRSVIPNDCWHEPYMPLSELEGEIAAGVVFSGYELDGRLVGVMGIQHMADVDLIRHAYVLPGKQQRGVGGALLVHLQKSSTRRMLVGTWADAVWAIRFYERHGFVLVSPAQKDSLLRKYWTISERRWRLLSFWRIRRCPRRNISSAAPVVPVGPRNNRENPSRRC